MSRVPSRVRLSTALALGLAACLVTAGSAMAQTGGTAKPAVAGGKPTTVAWAVDGLAPPVSARIPRSLVVTAPGFELDRRAVAKRCTILEARLNECPTKSSIGTAALTIIVHLPDRVNERTFDIVVYHGEGAQVLAVTDFIGIRVIPGQLTGGRSMQLTFDPLPEPPVIPGIEIQYEFKGVSVSLGRTRTVVKRRHGQGHRVRYSLVRTPGKCVGGSWAASAMLGFPDGTTLPLPTPMACRR